MRGNLSIRGVDPYSGSGDEDALSRFIELNASVFVRPKGSPCCPNTVSLGPLGSMVTNHARCSFRLAARCSIDRPGVAGQQSRTEVGIIQVLGDRGLIVRGSAEVQVTGQVYLSREEVDAWEVACLDRPRRIPSTRSATCPPHSELDSCTGPRRTSQIGIRFTGGAVTEFRANV